MLVLSAALGAPSPPPQMNKLAYHVANAAPGFEGAAFGFEGGYFEVLSPPIRSRYAGVVWRVLPPVDLPRAIVEQYNGSVMAVTGFEVDVVRVGADGAATPVPNYQSYNHHYVGYLRGAGAALPADAVGRPNVRHDLDFQPVQPHATGLTAAALGAAPAVQAFNEHNGNEARQSYHGLPRGYVQPIASPQTFVFNPMQINTLNPDGTGTRGGPLPRASAAPPDAAYSGLLECPCTTRITRDVAKKTLNGHFFSPHCTSDARSSDLLQHHNPTCDVATYVGGMECCRDGDVLLDADQTQPEHEDEVYFKWRFYHVPFHPKEHMPLVHLEWAVNGCDSGGPRSNQHNCRHIEYDVVAAPKGTPPSMAVHEVTSHFRLRDMLSQTACDVTTDPYCADVPTAMARGGALKLLMAGGHCHSPSCLSLELYNDDTGALLCRVTPVLGRGDDAHDERGYLWLPPCQWSEHDERLAAPPVLPLDANLTAVKRSNSSVYHYGVMGIFQMRGAYLSQ